ncbi:MAG: cobalt-precorrin 5A hydrolase [Methanobacteriota archaeon]|nr:MAG: cobalt-precorrin 5A hydrolase [Euryarchaeota archaeon]
MKTCVVIALPHSMQDAERIAGYLAADLVAYSEKAFGKAFVEYRSIVAVMSAGIVVRALAPLVQNKWEDPAVVVVSPDIRFAIPILGGHHGANELARRLEGCGCTAVITTATEACGREPVEGIAERLGCRILNRESTKPLNAAILEGDVPLYTLGAPGLVVAGPGVAVLLRKGTYTVGVGCRKGVSAEEVADAVGRALADAGVVPEEVLAYATTEKKRYETGLSAGIGSIGGVLVYLDDATVNRQAPGSPSAARRLGIQGVAEPCARAVAPNQELVMEKRTYGRVTVAIAR